MSRVCEVTGKRRLVGHKVSHSNMKSKVRKAPNLKTKKIFDPKTGKTVKVRIAVSTLRSLDKIGSLSKAIKKLSK
jgi:large subunit ribosomal protein L28